MRRPFLTGLILAVFTLSLVSQAHAWNGEAHQLVAWVAEERLSAKAQAGIKDLLDGASITDAEVAGWADEIRRERPKTAPWHYVNISVEADGYDPARDGKDGDNVIDAVERFTKVLVDRNAPREDRLEALKFIVHFVGDMHQPLHCADRNGDKGGNSRLVFFLERKRAISLHTVWDTLILPKSKGKQSVAEYGAELNGRITEKQAKAWSKGTPLDCCSLRSLDGPEVPTLSEHRTRCSKSRARMSNLRHGVAGRRAVVSALDLV